MTDRRLSQPRRLGVGPMLLLALVVFSCTVDCSRGLKFGGVTALGGATLLGCGAVWAVWFMRPILPGPLILPLLPLIMFQAYATGSLLWYSPGIPGLQLLAVGLEFLAIILLTVRETDRDPALAYKLHNTFLAASVMTILMYVLCVARDGMGADNWLLNARPFALFAMVVTAAATARWRTGSWLAFFWALVVVAMVFVSMSRTALVLCVILFPLSIALRGDRKSLMLAVMTLVIGAAAFTALLFTYRPLYERFFAYDASMKVGGVAVNASGRTRMWNIVLDALGDDWIFGKGVAASSNLIDQYFSNLGHPHNDFLRFYYDLGIVGLGLWLTFVVMILVAAFVNLRRSIRLKTPDYPLHLAALLALLAVSASSFTDNSVDYAFVMMPLAVLIGCSLGAGRATARSMRRLPGNPVQRQWVAPQIRRANYLPTT